jgi:hypothetical protein
MFTAVSTLPYSIYNLMMNEKTRVTDLYSHRQDRLVSDIIEGDFFTEALCNEINNVSPLSLVAGTEYNLPSRLFQKYFLGV